MKMNTKWFHHKIFIEKNHIFDQNEKIDCYHHFQYNIHTACRNNTTHYNTDQLYYQKLAKSLYFSSYMKWNYNKLKFFVTGCRI